MAKLPLKDPAKNFKTKKEKHAAAAQNKDVKSAERSTPKHSGKPIGTGHPRSGKSKGKMKKDC